MTALSYQSIVAAKALVDAAPATTETTFDPDALTVSVDTVREGYGLRHVVGMDAEGGQGLYDSYGDYEGHDAWVGRGRDYWVDVATGHAAEDLSDLAATHTGIWVSQSDYNTLTWRWPSKDVENHRMTYADGRGELCLYRAPDGAGRVGDIIYTEPRMASLAADMDAQGASGLLYGTTDGETWGTLSVGGQRHKVLDVGGFPVTVLVRALRLADAFPRRLPGRGRVAAVLRVRPHRRGRHRLRLRDRTCHWLRQGHDGGGR